jgi:RHS repeat-associated protein
VAPGDPIACLIDANDGEDALTCNYPPEYALDKDAPCNAGSNQAIGQNDLALGKAGGMFSCAPVRFNDGVVRYGETDLESDGFGIPWGQTRSWTNGVGYANGQYNGWGWVDDNLPRIIERSTDGAIILITNGTTARFFIPDPQNPSTYVTAVNAREHIDYDSANAQYILTDTVGDRFYFEDVAGMLPFAQLGSFKKALDPAGNVTQVMSRNLDGKITEVQRSGTVGGVTVTESYLYSYLSSGTNNGLMASVTLRRQTGGGAWSTVQSVEYTYYDGVEAHGPARALKLAVVKDGNGNAIDTSYYRYYVTGEANGYKNGLKYAFKPASYARLAAAFADPSSATDAQVAPYADNYFEYDGSQRVTKEIAQGDGCSSCTGGLGTYQFSYTQGFNPNDPNNWSMKTVETMPDNSTLTVYTNAWGEPIVSALGVGANQWIVHTRYDDHERPILVAYPSAVSGYSEVYSDLMNYSGGVSPYVNDTSGLIVKDSFYSATDATASTAAGVYGYYASENIQQGETGTAVPQEAWKYFTRTVSGNDVGFVGEDKRFRNDDGTGAQATTFSYTWQGTSYQPDTITMTLPTVTAAQNGPGTADTMAVAFDTYGRPIWTKDGDGFLDYAEYDLTTGGVTKSITDVNTALTSDFTGLPAGWSTPSGGGLHLKTAAEVDALGRDTKVTAPNGNVTYLTYNDANHEARVYRGWNTSTNLPTGPTEVYRIDRPGSYTEALTMSATPAVTGGRPTGGESISGVQTDVRDYTNAAGQVVNHDEYFNLAGLTYTNSTTFGTENTNYYRTRLAYDERGRLARTQTPTGTIYRTVFDELGRPVSDWVGTNDTPGSGFWSPGNNTPPSNMVQVRSYEYDNNGVGDSNLTAVVEIPGGGASNRRTEYYYDWRERLVAGKAGVGTTESTSVNRPIFYLTYDNLSEVTQARAYDGDGVSITSSGGVPVAPSASLLRAQINNSFDEQGRLYQSQTFSVDPGTGSVSANALTTNTWRDHRGNTIRVSEPGGLVSKYQYDGAGRTIKAFATDGGGDTAWADAGNVTGDAVLQQVEYGYDASGNVIQTTLWRRFHDETATGALGDPNTGPKARVSYTASYYDLADRPTAVVDVGTNGGSAWTRPSSVPARSDTVLVTDFGYNAAGWVETTTDPKGIAGKTFYDNLGRATKTVDDYTNGVPTNSSDKTTEFTYDGSNHLLTLQADLAGGAFERTQWNYGTSTAAGDVITSNDVLKNVRYPDKSSGVPSATEQETYTVNGLAQTATVTDRNGNVHSLSYDVLGRLTADAVTTLGVGVDGAVRRMEIAYDTQGNPYLFTSYDAASGGNVVNQVQRDFNGLGQMIREYQEHAGAVATGTTPKVQYAYSEMAGGANHSRLTSMTYPNGKVLNFNYSTGLNDNISRLSSLSDSTGTLESYDYLGVGTVVRRAHPQPGVDLTYIKQTGEGNGDAGDQYTGLDRFDRVFDQRWLKTSTGSATDRFQYTYDRDGNRLTRSNLVNGAFNESYSYDNLNQLTSFARGSHSQSWGYDALGNMGTVTTDGTPQTRTHNLQNEISTIGAATLTFDANGNMTTDEAGRQFVYDAWNRLVAAKNSGGTTIAQFKYDALSRRVSQTEASTTTDFSYSAAWQVLEERVGGVAKAQYVWSPVYVDALVLRDRDADGNPANGLEERLWVQQDANFNVTALLDNSGNVVERYAYDPFGNFTVYDAAYNVRTGGSNYAWVYEHQGLRYDEVVTLYDNRVRWYDPQMGRFIAIDPLGFVPGDVNLI